MYGPYLIRVGEREEKSCSSFGPTPLSILSPTAAAAAAAQEAAVMSKLIVEWSEEIIQILVTHTESTFLGG